MTGKRTENGPFPGHHIWMTLSRTRFSDAIPLRRARSYRLRARQHPSGVDALESEFGMAEIDAGTAVGVDRAVFRLRGSTFAKARLARGPSPSVVLQLA